MSGPDIVLDFEGMLRAFGLDPDDPDAFRRVIDVRTQDEKDGAALRLLETEASKRALSVACKSEPELGYHWRVKLMDRWYSSVSEEYTAATIAEAADAARAALEGK